MSKLGSGAVTAIPEMYFNWDGVSFDKLGIMPYLASAEFATTCGKSKSKSRKMRTGKTKVGAATLNFLLPDDRVAYNLNRLLTVRSRPVISVGCKVQGVQQDSGVWIGAFKIDKIDWSYQPEGVVALKITGLTDKVMGLAERSKPRVFQGKTFLQMLEKIAKEHDLKLHPETRKELATRVETYSIGKPSTESDWSFIERMSISAGLTAMYLDTDDEREGLARFNSPTLNSQKKYEQGYPKVKPSRKFNRKPLSKTDLDDIGRPNYASEMASNLEDELNPDEVMENLQVSMTKAARKIGQLSKIMLRLGEQPGFMHQTNLAKKFGTFIIGYGPGLDATGRDAVHMLAQQITINVEGYKAGASPSSTRTKSNGDTDSLAVAPGVKGKYKAKVFRERSSLKRHLTGAEKKKKKKGGKAKGPNFLVRDRDNSSMSYAYRVYSSSAPDTVTDMHPSRKLAAIALANSFVPTISVVLKPGVPHIQAGGKVRLMGTYAHDGDYGVEQCTLTWNASDGLVTKLDLKVIAKGGSKKKKKGGKGADYSHTAVAPGIKGKTEAKVFQERASLKKALGDIKVLKKKTVIVGDKKITVQKVANTKRTGSVQAAEPEKKSSEWNNYRKDMNAINPNSKLGERPPRSHPTTPDPSDWSEMDVSRVNLLQPGAGNKL